MSEHISLSRICDEATEDGGWIDLPFEAIVRNAKAGRGKQPSKADLIDPANPRVKVEACFFGGSFLDYEGSVVRFSGKGRKAKLYEGNVEISLYEKATVNVLGDAPATTRTAEAARGEAPPPGGDAGAKARAPKVEGDPTSNFHKEMKKASLLWTHAHQYARNVEAKLYPPPPGSKTPHFLMPPDLFQSLVSGLFITAKDRGLLERPPAPRQVDEIGVPFAYLPPEPDPAAVEEAARKAREAAEAEARRKHQENLDEDVPF